MAGVSRYGMCILYYPILLSFLTHNPRLLPGLSKLANVLFAKELQKRFDAEKIPAIAVSLHPGVIGTGAIFLAVRCMKQTLANFIILHTQQLAPSDSGETKILASRW